MHDGKFNLVSTEQKLLFDIRELLIEQNKLLRFNFEGSKPLDAIEKVKEEIIPQVKNNGVRGRK